MDLVEQVEEPAARGRSGPGPNSTAAESWRNIQAAHKRRRSRVKLLEGAFGPNFSYRGGLRNLDLGRFDRKVANQGDWIPRPGRGGDGSNWLWTAIQREDRGIIKRLDEGSLLVYARQSARGEPIRVVPRPALEAQFECLDGACKARRAKNPKFGREGHWCYHVDIARCDAGLTKIEELRAALFPEKKPRPRPQIKGAPRKIQAPSAVVIVKDAGDETPPASRPQVRGARAKPRRRTMPAPTPPPPCLGGVVITVANIPVRIGTVPIHVYEEVLQTTREVLEGTKPILAAASPAGPDPTRPTLLDALETLGKGVAHSRETILATMFPTWATLAETNRTKARSKLSQIVFGAPYDAFLGDHRYTRIETQDPADKRKTMYGIKDA